MTGGIYCEAPLGSFYEERVLGSVHKRMKELFGTSEGLPTNKTLSEEIVDYWYKDVSRKMSRILSSWKVPGSRGYYNRTVDLTRSICMGIYHNGKLKRTYRFKGGQREKGDLEASDMGTSPSVSDMKRMSWLGKRRHPDPAERSEQFLNEYDLIYKRGFTIVVAATMPYAVRLEKQYRLPVLSIVINRILADVYEFKGASSIKNGAENIKYGYIFEKGAYE